MKITSVSHVISARKEAGKWTTKDDFVLQLLAGTQSYRDIAAQLGRSHYAVVKRGTVLRLRIAQQAAAERALRKLEEAERRKSLLLESPENLKEFAPECDEPPVLPHVAGSEYFRLKKQEARSKPLT